MQEKNPHDSPVHVVLTTLHNGTVTVEASPSPVRTWVLRVHLRPGQRLRAEHPRASTESTEHPRAGVQMGSVRHLLPDCTSDHFPFEGPGSRPACHGGAIAEVRVQVVNEGWRLQAEVVEE